jgi:hypothetical protein
LLVDLVLDGVGIQGDFDDDIEVIRDAAAGADAIKVHGKFRRMFGDF